MTVDPIISEFLDMLARTRKFQIYELPVPDARALVVSRQGGFTPMPAADRQDLTLPVGPSGSLSASIYRPVGVMGKLPVLIYFHGGGWVLCDGVTHERLARDLCNSTGAAVLFIEYTRSPEARYPTALEQAYATTVWVAQHGREHGLDPDRLIVAGESAGANMATVVCLLAKRRSGPAIRCQVLLYPVTDCVFDTPSYRAFGTEHYLTLKAMEWFWGHYLPDTASRLDATACPLRATNDDLRELPPALVITAECDVLRDEGEAYAGRLMQAGVAVTATRYLGVIHDFATINAISHAPAARAAIAQVGEYVRRTCGAEILARRSL